MESPESKFNSVLHAMVENNHEVAAGPMMSSPGIRYQGKVFAFFWKDKMGFRLGKDFNPKTIGIDQWEYLSPFKNKPPMKGWFMIDESYATLWTDLSEMALQKMKYGK